MGGGRNLNDIGLENLRFGIVEQAVDDYFSLLAGFITPTTDCNIAELERFFYSDWFSVLCELEPDYIIENLKRKAKKMILDHEYVLHSCAKLLLEKEKISGEEFEALFTEKESPKSILEQENLLN